jgi:hypothetical protein
MSRPVALRQRAQFAALLTAILHTARQAPTWHEPGHRQLRLWRQLLLAVLVQRSTRLLILAQALFPLRRGTSIKTVAQGLGAFLRSAHCPVDTFSPTLLAAVLTHLDPARLLRAHGRALLVIDATEYPKRSRGCGKRGQHMQHLGRVRNAHGKVSWTTYGYVDIWAGLVLKGKRFVPLARQLFSSTHPSARSQNQVEEAVLQAALTTAAQLPWPVLVVADRGFGRKALLIRLAQQRLALVIRIDPDILVQARGMAKEALLAPVLAEQPWLGAVIWDRGAEGKGPCRARTDGVRICVKRSGHPEETRYAMLNFVELVPQRGRIEPLVVATNLPARTAAEAQKIAHIYAQRWAIESAFETMKAWGLEQFMVRQWVEIDRLLWLVAVAYALATLALYCGHLGSFRTEALRLLRQCGAVGRRLTVGKLVEAVAVDFRQHRRAVLATWRL